jgi:hypothetical protein
MKVSQIVINIVAIWSNNTTTGYMCERNETNTSKRSELPLFNIERLSTQISKVSIEGWEDKEDVTHTACIHRYTMENYFAFKRKANLVICDNMDEPRGHYTKWKKPGREAQILHNLTYMWNLKKWNLLKQRGQMVTARGWGWG